MRRDIDEALRNWPLRTDHQELQAREVKAGDGRMVLQIRVELGILQIETSDRPDGSRPHGHETYLDYMVTIQDRAAYLEQPWTLSNEDREEADREFVQYYHRRMAWLALHRYDRALRDAEHTLRLMDFVTEHCDDPDYVTAHERLRGLVLYHQTQARAALALENHRYEDSVDAVRQGIARLDEHRQTWFDDPFNDEDTDQALIEQLRRLDGELRKNFEVTKTLREQLDEAIASENYEVAARLRDKLEARKPPG